MQLQPNYIVDNHNHRIAVQLDIKTEDYALFKFMNENKDEDYVFVKMIFSSKEALSKK